MAALLYYLEWPQVLHTGIHPSVGECIADDLLFSV